MSDTELLNLMYEAPEQGIDMMIQLYGKLVYSIIYNRIRSVGNTQDAEEGVSDVFIMFYQKSDTYIPEKGDIKVTLSVMATRKSIDLYRHLLKENIQTQSVDIMPDFADNSVPLEDHIILKEHRSSIFKAIHTLGEPDSEILLRKYFLGQRSKEIASILNLKENTIDKKVSRSLKKMRILLGGEIS